MSFINRTDALIRKSNNHIAKFNLDNNLIYHNIDNNLNESYSCKVLDGLYSFADINLDINNDDSIYGLVNDKKGKLINLHIKDDSIDKTTLIKYDNKQFTIKFPYIKNILGDTHVIYFSINQKYINLSALVHIYIKDSIPIKSNIDFIKNNIINNFVVTWNNNTPSIFYFKLLNGYEELFVSTFNSNTLSWSNPLQITNSHKHKIYLSVIKCRDNSYHIAFSENNEYKYYYRYINGYFKYNKFCVNNSNLIKTNIMCLFPNIIEYNSILYAQWIEFHDLYISNSIDLGRTWSKPILENSISAFPFMRYDFKSNNYEDYNKTASTIFCGKNDFKILGI